jgi:hypothetical protein
MSTFQSNRERAKCTLSSSKLGNRAATSVKQMNLSEMQDGSDFGWLGILL